MNSSTSMGTNRLGILVLAAATGLIHLILLNIRMMDVTGKIDVLFTLNGLGFLGFLAAYFLPLPLVKDMRPLVRWAFIGYTLVTILAWVAMGDKSLPNGLLGYITKLIEVVLVFLLWRDRPGS